MPLTEKSDVSEKEQEITLAPHRLETLPEKDK